MIGATAGQEIRSRIHGWCRRNADSTASAFPSGVLPSRPSISRRATFVCDRTQIPCRRCVQRRARMASLATSNVVLPLPGHASTSRGSSDLMTASRGSTSSAPVNAVDGSRSTRHAHAMSSSQISGNLSLPFTPLETPRGYRFSSATLSSAALSSGARVTCSIASTM